MVWNCIFCANITEDVLAVEKWFERDIAWICPNHNYNDIDKVIELTDEVTKKNVRDKLSKQFKIFCENIGLDS